MATKDPGAVAAALPSVERPIRAAEVVGALSLATDDADATAAKAAELGGKVIIPPFDAPWVRMAVISDPQGATFIASKFVPENRDLAGQTDATASAA